MLGDANFLKKLMEYDKDNIAQAVQNKLKKYIDNPKFTPDEVGRVSKVRIYISCDAKKNVFWVSYQFQHKLGCTITEDSQMLETSDLERLSM